MIRFSAILIIFLLEIAIGARAQQRLGFQHISIEQGLSNSAVESILKDSQGQMWFGTRNGLNRYDGNKITVFRNDIHNPNSISENLIYDIYEDKTKRMWIATNKGLDLFNREKEIFSHFLPSKEQVSIRTICPDEVGNLWLGTNAGLIHFDVKNKKFVPVQLPKGAEKLITARINKVTQDIGGNLWVGTEQGLYRLNLKKSESVLFNIDKDNPNALHGNKVHEIFQDSKGNMWIGMGAGGLALYNTEKNTFKTYLSSSSSSQINLAHNDVDCITEDGSGLLWIGTENGGLSIFDAVKKEFTNYRPDRLDPNSLSHDSIHSIYKDPQGNVWIGTWAGGVNLYNPSALKFQLYNKFPGSRSTGIESIFCDSKGIIWLGAVGSSLYRYDPKTRAYTYYSNPNSARFDASIYDIKEFNPDTLVIATRRGGMAFFNKKTGVFTHFLSSRYDPTKIAGNELITVCVDQQKNVWCGGWNIGLSRFDRNRKKFTNYRHNPKDNSSLNSNQIYTILTDRYKNVWVGTEDGGLDLYDATKDNFIHHVSKSGNRHSIGSNTVFSLFEDSRNNFWVGTSNGLNLFDRKKKEFTSFSGKYGLPDDAINSIVEDLQGKLWLGTDRGLYCFDPLGRTVKQFYVKDGLQGNTFLHNSASRDFFGNIYFSGYKGLNIFDPSEIPYDKFVPPVILTGLSIANKPVAVSAKDSLLTSHISQLKELVLSHRQSVFTLDFAALSYSSPENNKYAYKMEGFDKDWNYVGSSHSASYTNLDPGIYTFSVIASNSDGVWNKTGASLKIRITPPFWETWWFRSLILISILYIAFILLSYRRRQELRVMEESKRNELQDLQLKFFTNISHEFRTPLSLIMGPLETLMGNDTVDDMQYYHRMMMRNAGRLMNLINELMDFSKIEAGVLKLQVAKHDLNAFVHQIAEDFRIHAAKRNIAFEVNAHLSDSAWFDQQIMEKIILNLISNALKYTNDGGNVTISVADKVGKFDPHFQNTLMIRSGYQAKDYFLFIIKDSGIGISKESIDQLFERYYRISTAHLGSGVGLAFVKSLTFLHKGKILVSSEKNKGTEIIIAIPRNKEDYLDSEIANEDTISVQLESLQMIEESPIPVLSAKAASFDQDNSLPNRQHLLVVDDNDELREFLHNSLKLNYDISEARNGIDGIRKAKEVYPDLIISDVMMPDMDGLQFCRMLRDDVEISHIPFMLLTAKSSLDSEIEGVDSGADFYFKKPVSINLLNLTLRNIFLQKQKLIDRYAKDYQAEVKELVHNTKDKALLEKLIKTIESQLLNPDLDIDFICSEIGMSRTSLYNKIKGLTNLSLVDFLRKIRLRKALEIMLHEDVQLSEVMYRVGIHSQSHFTRAFKKEFGKTPSQYLREIEKK